MSNVQPGLSAGAVRMVLAALEAPLARLSPTVVKRREADAVMLLNAGLIKPAGHEPVITAPDDFADSPLAVSWDQEHGSFGYFTALHGWREVASNQITSYDIDVVRFMAVLTQKCSIAGKVAELVPSLMWQLGLARLGKHPKRIPLLFARRLQDGEVLQKITSLFRNRPSQERRIVLTSTNSERTPPDARLCTFVSIKDVLDSTTHDIDPTVLSLRIDHPNVSDTEEPIQLLADGRIVIFLGKRFRLTKGLLQRDLIRRLHQYYLSGEHPVSSAKLVENLGVGDHTRIRDLFNKSPVWGELLMEQHGMCGFCFPGLFDKDR